MDNERIPFGKMPFGNGNVIIKLCIKREDTTIKNLCNKFNLLYRPSKKGTVIYGIISTDLWDDLDEYLIRTKLQYDMKVASDKYYNYKKSRKEVGKIPLKSEDLSPDDLPF